MTYLIDMRDDDPFARATDLINPIRRVGFDADGEFTVPAPSVGPREDSPAMIAALERAAQRGREWRASKFYQPGFFGNTRSKETLA